MKKSTLNVVFLCMFAVILVGCSGKEKIDVSDKPYANWDKTDPIVGSNASSSAPIVPGFNQWFSGELTGGFQLFALNLEPGRTYQLFWDDVSEGSGKYSGDIVMWVFRKDATTKYDSRDLGYREPIIIKADDTVFYLGVTSLKKGSFAFGIKD